jgi:hypothetical protein
VPTGVGGAAPSAPPRERGRAEPTLTVGRFPSAFLAPVALVLVAMSLVLASATPRFPALARLRSGLI